MSDASATAETTPALSRLPERRRAEESLQLFARAVQQHHIYPATSPLCVHAIDAWHRALSLLTHRDSLDFRVAPGELILDDVAVGGGTLVETELAHRLHAAGIAQVAIERTASARELTHFCVDLLMCTDRHLEHLSLVELLAEHGVSRIAVRQAYRPEVLDVGAPSAEVAALLAEQRLRHDSRFTSGAPVHHLYPPDRGWVRLDPGSVVSAVSLADLALLVDDPTSLAAMLVRLTDDTGAGAPGDALTRKFGDVTTLFAALDPAIARVMFSRLARAVLDLDAKRRQSLLRRTILPGLLDGRMEGEVLKDFPDRDLADSLCLLLDLEAAAPEVVTTALARLELSPERHTAMLPLIHDRLQTHAVTTRDTSLDARAHALVSVDGARSKSFVEFAAFDLALDPTAVDTLIGIRERISTTDITSDQLTCLCNLARLEPNPDLIQRLMQRVTFAIDRLDADDRWPLLSDWLTRFTRLAAELREARPDVADVITTTLAACNSIDRAHRIIALAGQSAEGRAAADTVIISLGPAIGPALATAVGSRGADARDGPGRVGQQLLCDHAALVAPAAAAALATADAATARVLVRVLSLAGSGYEAVLAAQLHSPDEQTAREALRGLRRTATPLAATFVRAAIGETTTWLAAAAAETLWHFPAAEARRQVLDLLSHPEFVRHQPLLATRLLDRAALGGGDDLPPVLATLASLRYRVWNPPLARFGRHAHAILHQ